MVLQLLDVDLINNIFLAASINYYNKFIERYQTFQTVYRDLKIYLRNVSTCKLIEYVYLYKFTETEANIWCQTLFSQIPRESKLPAGT